jgi:serine/threonine protein kinase
MNLLLAVYLLVDVVVVRYKNQNVAIKIVHKGDTPEEVVKRQGRFLREVTMLSRVQHKNLVKVCFFLTIVIFHCAGIVGCFWILKTIYACCSVHWGLPRACHGGGD